MGVSRTCQSLAPMMPKITVTATMPRASAVTLARRKLRSGQRGEHGMGSNCSGLDGNSTILQAPVGTSLYDQETGELMHDFSEPDERVIIAKGGRGGRGNQHFATSTHRAPRDHELGRAS